jgi:hypothetical protein
MQSWLSGATATLLEQHALKCEHDSRPRAVVLVTTGRSAGANEAATATADETDMFGVSNDGVDSWR